MFEAGQHFPDQHRLDRGILNTFNLGDKLSVFLQKPLVGVLPAWNVCNGPTAIINPAPFDFDVVLLVFHQAVAFLQNPDNFFAYIGIFIPVICFSPILCHKLVLHFVIVEIRK